MKSSYLRYFLCFLLFFLTLSVQAQEASDAILGIWHTTDNKSQVKIFNQNGHYFARVLNLTRPNYPLDDKSGMGGKPRTDRNNPNPGLRDRPILGLLVMSNFAYAGKNRWEDGRVYDPESGKTYKCKMTLVSAHKLEVRGYIGFSLLGRTVIWTR